jgi:methionyl-tRNA formyltransferase
MAEAVDSGDIVAQQRVPIGPDETIAEMMERVTDMYLDLLETTLPALLTGSAPRVPQDQEAATFTCKRLPEDNAIDWTADTASIYNLIRAVTAPYPGAYTTLAGNRLVVWGARRVVVRPYVGRVPGRVVEIRPGEGVVVLTGDGELLLTDVQPDGQPRQPAADVLNSLNITLGR